MYYFEITVCTSCLVVVENKLTIISKDTRHYQNNFEVYYKKKYAQFAKLSAKLRQIRLATMGQPQLATQSKLALKIRRQIKYKVGNP